jgi:hypothetical protein
MIEELPNIREANKSLIVAFPKLRHYHRGTNAVVNKAYQTTGFPEKLVLAMLYNGQTLEQICDINDRLGNRDLLNQVVSHENESTNRHINSYRCMALAKGVDNLDERLTQLKKIAVAGHERLMQQALEAEIEDPIAYTSLATDEDVAAFEKSFKYTWNDTDALKQCLKFTKPTELRKVAPLYLHMTYLQRNEFFNGMPKETITAYAALSKDEREKLNYDSPFAAGVLLRVYGTFSPVEAQPFFEDLGTNFVHITNGMEPFLKDFFSLYNKSNCTDKAFLRSEIYDGKVKKRSLIMQATVKHFANNTSIYERVMMLMDHNLEDDTIMTICENDSLHQQYTKTPHKGAWMDLYCGTSPEFMSEISEKDVNPVIMAYKSALARNEMSSFIEGLKLVKPAKIGEWAQTILDHNNKDVKGGDNYDNRREVIAA